MFFTVGKDKWNSKEDTGKSLKNALYILRYAKGTSRAEATLNREKFKPVALSIMELCQSEGISLLVSQTVSRNFFFKFRGNFLKAFWVDLKACLDLVLPIQYYPIIAEKIEAGDFTAWATPISWSSLL